ncbi:MAG: type II secretion system F family protein [Candidatus Pacebacteria bacterium]|nr:type II secretion system F family protein [Candidatus Paceibacterota bacterium]
MPILNKISTQEKVDFIRNLSLLVKSGAPIDQSFNVLAEQAGPSMKNLLMDGKKKIEKGTPVSEVFASNSNFDGVFVSFIKAGEESGTLSENLEYLADWLDGSNTLEKELSSATLYPKIIITFAVIMGLILALWVLPSMVQVFQTLDVELPLATVILLSIANAVDAYPLEIVLGVFFLIVFVLILFRIKAFRKIFYIVVLRTPVVGPLLKDYELAVIAQLGAVLLKSGTSIGRVFDILAESTSNYEYKEAIADVSERIQKGTSLVEALRAYPRLFPSIFSSVVAVGEETGSLSNSFGYLARFFTNRVKDKTAKLPTVIEPLLLVTIGLFVAFIAVAIIMPIYEVTKGLY